MISCNLGSCGLKSMVHGTTVMNSRPCAHGTWRTGAGIRSCWIVTPSLLWRHMSTMNAQRLPIVPTGPLTASSTTSPLFGTIQQAGLLQNQRSRNIMSLPLVQCTGLNPWTANDLAIYHLEILPLAPLDRHSRRGPWVQKPPSLMTFLAFVAWATAWSARLCHPVPCVTPGIFLSTALVTVLAASVPTLITGIPCSQPLLRIPI